MINIENMKNGNLKNKNEYFFIAKTFLLDIDAIYTCQYHKEVYFDHGLDKEEIEKIAKKSYKSYNVTDIDMFLKEINNVLNKSFDCCPKCEAENEF